MPSTGRLPPELELDDETLQVPLGWIGIPRTGRLALDGGTGMPSLGAPLVVELPGWSQVRPSSHATSSSQKPPSSPGPGF